MSLLRMFLQTASALASAGQWDLLREFFLLIRLIIQTPEAVLVPGVPVDKPI